MDVATATKVLSVLQRRGDELSKLAAQAGGDLLQPFLDQHPEIQQKLGGGWKDLKELADKNGAPEAKKMVEETTKQVQDLFKEGFSADTIAKAKKLLDEKVEQVRKLSDKVSSEAWDKAIEVSLQSHNS